MNKDYQICTRCIVDTTVPGVTFDENGVCSFCKLHDKLDQIYPLNEEGKKQQQKILEKIKRSGKNKKYDCVVGISGGRDSTYNLYLAKNVWGLRPLAVHFNDGFGNPVGGENMKKSTQMLGVDIINVSSDWRETKDLRIASLKSSTPDIQGDADIGIATALYGTAVKYGVKYILIGQSFRTEGICPLEWNYLDGKYMLKVHDMFGKVKLRKWKPDDPGYNMELRHIFYYSIIKRIRTVTPLYYENYVRSEAEKIIKEKLDWVDTGAHYYDDLYQSLITHVLRTKFGIDRRKFNYSALVRSGQMTREEALERVKNVYVIEDPKVINLCLKRLGITREEFDSYMALPPKTFRDYPNNYNLLKALKIPIKILCYLHLLPKIAYDKYFNFA
jgi:N-acetyl sugar amidotransferase